MKKSKLLTISSIGLAALLVACTGENVTSQNPTSAVSTTTTTTPTTSPIATTADENVYKVTVVYASNNQPVTGVKVQWCNASGCKLPKAVDENGVATMPVEPGSTFSVHLNGVPSGYTYNAFEVKSSDTTKEVTVHVYELGTKTGEGTATNPYVIGTGYYETTACAKSTPQYYKLTGLTPGTYVIESYAAAVSGTVDTDFALIEDGKFSVKGKDDGNEYNFRYEFTVTEDLTTLDFAVNNVTNEEAFPFSVTKTN